MLSHCSLQLIFSGERSFSSEHCWDSSFARSFLLSSPKTDPSRCYLFFTKTRGNQTRHGSLEWIFWAVLDDRSNSRAPSKRPLIILGVLLVVFIAATITLSVLFANEKGKSSSSSGGRASSNPILNVFCWFLDVPTDVCVTPYCIKAGEWYNHAGFILTDRTCSVPF